MPEALKPGDPGRAGPYELLARLGGGGMGQVYLGRSPGGRPVAIKVIRSELLAGQPDFRIRFAREVAAARRVSALFTAPVVDADPDADYPWLATAYVPGPSLADAVGDHGPLDPPVVRALAAGLAEGLAAIHAAGVVHRDMKPSNVLLAGDGPRIIDFGISRAADASALTGTGMIVGTPAFMSPEQADGREAGPASDVFSLGSVLAFASTGLGPFRAELVPALLYQVVNAQPDIAGLPPDLAPLVRRCLAKNPPDRPEPGEIVAELGPAGLLQDWLPQAIAETLPGYAVSAVPGRSGAGVRPPPGPAAATSVRPDQPAGRQRATPSRVVGPPPGAPPQVGPHPGLPAQPTRSVSAPRMRHTPYSSYRPPPPSAAARQQPDYPVAGWRPVRVRGAGVLPPEYRFGWLSLPALALLAAAAFVVPLETFWLLTWGFAVILVASRLAAAWLWSRRRGVSGLPGLAARCLAADVAGAIGLAGVALVSLFLTAFVLLPAIGPGPPGAYGQALSANGSADPFASHRQVAYFLHFFALPGVLAVGCVVLLRARADLARPLLLPRVARYLNQRSAAGRLLASAVLIGLAAGLIALNGGVDAGRLPAGAVCTVARQTCAAVRTHYVSPKLSRGHG